MVLTVGFADVTFTDVREPMYFGPDVATALDWVRGFACTREALDRLDRHRSPLTGRPVRDNPKIPDGRTGGEPGLIPIDASRRRRQP